MKLDNDSIEYLLNVVRTAKLVGIENVIIEPDLVRAIDDAKSVVLYQNKNVPQMPFGSIGLTRTDVFLARYEIARTQDNFTVEVSVDDSGDYARSLIMKAKGTKIDYRCGNPTKINAPRQVNDTLSYRVQLTADGVLLLQKGQAAMNCENVAVVSDEEGVSFQLTDINNDTFKHTFATEVEDLQGSNDVSFAHRYPVKILLSLFKQNPTGSFEVGSKGILSFPINNLTVFVLPQV